MKKLTAILLLFFLVSCKQEKETTSIKYYNKITLNNSIKKENIFLSYSTINPEDNLETSYNGSYTVANDKLVFNDVYFGYLFCFDNNLKLISKHFGRGKKPNELIGADCITYSSLTDKYYVLSSKTGIIAVVNSKFQKEKEFEINYNIKRTKEAVIDKPLPYLMDSYEIDYGYDGILQVFDQNHLAIAITSSHPKFNGYYNSESYYANSRIIALINIEDEYIDRLMGRRPTLFLKKNLPNYDHFNYAFTNDALFLNFYPEATIYKIDKIADTVSVVIGAKGQGMKTDYVTTNSYETAYNREFVDYNTFSFYNSLFIDGNIVFRGYTKDDATKDGMQIYKNQKLIADVDFPKGYKIIGSINNYFYASKIKIHKKEDMKILKIKISGL